MVEYGGPVVLVGQEVDAHVALLTDFMGRLYCIGIDLGELRVAGIAVGLQLGGGTGGGFPEEGIVEADDMLR